MRKKVRPFELADLIDLEVQLHRDREVDVASLRDRDRTIGQTIGAADASPRAQIVGWLDQIREGQPGETEGQKVARFLEFLGAGLVLLGLALGAGTVAGWLAYDTHRPVNVVFFWSTLVGLQIALLLGWLIAALPASWLRILPGATAVQAILQSLGRVPPALLAWLAGRCSGELRTTLAALHGETKRLDWLYGRLKFWTLVRLTQLFAVAYNVGAIVLFIALSYGNDPTFGWKSTLMRPGGMHRVVQAIAWPWSAWTDAVPTEEEIRRTHYTSLEDRFVGRSHHDRIDDVQTWASWWPFLLASLLVYGLAPRVATLALAHWQVHRMLRLAPRDHHELDKLLARMVRPQVATQARSPDRDGAAAQGITVRKSVDRLDLAVDGQTVPVLQWAGVDLAPDVVRTLLGQRLGVRVSAIETLGQLAPSADQEALDSIVRDGKPSAVVLIVEAWEPPVAEYMDFLAQLRAALGEGVAIVVLLYHPDRDGIAKPPNPDDFTIWQRRLAATGDAWLDVHPLVACDPATEDTV